MTFCVQASRTSRLQTCARPGALTLGTSRWAAKRSCPGRQCAAPFTRRGGPRSVSQRGAMAASTPMVEQIKEKNQKYPVMIYAKSYCPFCGQVKGLFKKLQVDFQAVNLDEIHEGEEIQDELAGLTGSSTVPQVFIGAKFVGGCDDLMKLNSSGQLNKLLDDASISHAS